MAKYLRKKKRQAPQWGDIAVTVFLLLAIAAVLVIPQWVRRASGHSEDTIPSDMQPQSSSGATESSKVTAPSETKETLPAVAFPLVLDGERLEINSLFQYSGINPDCENQEGTDIAAIVLKNVSDLYLAEARITLTLQDGSLLHFQVTELPAGASVMAFSTKNSSLADDAACVDVSVDSSYDIAAVTVSDQVTATAVGSQIILTNVSGQAISQIVVYCRSPLGEYYFGGTTYSYTVTDLPAGESAVVDAVDCILGMAEVVRLAVN